MISHAEARILLKNRLAVVHKVYPFTIRLRDNSCVNNDKFYTVKIDPGSKTTGVAIVDNTDKVVMLAEIEHRGHVIKRNLDKRRAVRNSRRQRKTRYRPARFLNRTKPKGSKSVEGFQTGDIVKAIVTKGLKQGEYLGKVAVRSKGSFNIQTRTQVIQGVGYKYCHIIQRCDGYLYDYKECDFLSAINNRVSIAKI